MQLRTPRISLPAWVTTPLEWAATALYLAVFGLPILIVCWLAAREGKISREWHPYFAWKPTRCDDWPDGFTGTVWLETIERRHETFPLWGVRYRRPLQNAQPSEAARNASPQGNSGRNND